jgi:NADH-quinone oxidoreductase subunit M
VTDQTLVVALLVLPLVGSVVMLVAGRGADRWAPAFGVAVTGVELGLALLLLARFDLAHADVVQHPVSERWLPVDGLDLRLGVDGLSLPLVVLTALLSLVCAVYSLRRVPDGRAPRAYVGLFCLLQVGLMGTFVALDLLSFFVFFEFVLVPMWFLIAWWGSEGARRSATVFLLYTVGGSLLMLLGFLWLWGQTGTTDIGQLAVDAGAAVPHGAQLGIALLIGVGLAVKTPMWPLHGWLPDAHTAAPTAASVLLAGVLLKMGTYGMVRVLLPVVPEGVRALAPFAAGFAVVGILYGAAASYAQRDLKRLIAFSSVAHMGFVLLGIATLTAVGVNGAMFGNVAHGLITGLLFLVAGSLKERVGTLDLATMPRSLYARAPWLGFALGFGAVASLGLPGLAGFWGEFLPMLGAYEPALGNQRWYHLLLVLAAVGTVLAAAYLLRPLRRVAQGPRTRDRLPDLDGSEVVSFVPLVVLVVLLGLLPALLLDVTGPVVRATVTLALTGAGG